MICWPPRQGAGAGPAFCWLGRFFALASSHLRKPRGGEARATPAAKNPARAGKGTARPTNNVAKTSRAPAQVWGVSAMIPEMLEVLLRVLLWGGLPLLLVVLAIGPRRV